MRKKARQNGDLIIWGDLEIAPNDPGFDMRERMTVAPAEVYRRRQRVAECDIDGFGHVNNGRYVDWANEIAWEHSQALGLSIDDYHRIGVGCVVWRHEFDYLAPLLLGDDIEIATWIAENDRRLTLTRAYRITRLANGKEAFRGRTKFVSVDMKSGRPARAPAEFLRAYAPFEGEP